MESQTSDPIETVNRVRAKNLQMPLPDPHHIEGFGPGEPPPPPIPDFSDEALPALELPAEPDEPEEAGPPSPLVALGRGAEPRVPAAPAVPAVSLAALGVYDAAAIYKGRTATLTEEEQALVARVVVGAIHREALEAVRSVRALLPKRGYRQKQRPKAALLEQAAQPKKRRRKKETGSGAE